MTPGLGLLKFYFDEDATFKKLAVALRAREVELITAQEAGRAGFSDEEQLLFATQRNSALYTFNVSDFCRLHFEWAMERREHTGIIVAQQQRFSVGEQLRRILRLRAEITPANMRNRLEFLSNWG